MNIELSDAEIRILGCLLEKEMTTPDYYPLSLNALVQACNQKSNRKPVVNYDKRTVQGVVESLVDKKMVCPGSVGRVVKYSHLFAKKYNLLPKEVAVISLLMLRGKQTPGELRSRTERLRLFDSLEEVTETLRTLADIGLVRKLSKLPGQKESRYIHLFDHDQGAEQTTSPRATCVPETSGKPGYAELAREVESLRAELQELRKEFQEFRMGFE